MSFIKNYCFIFCLILLPSKIISDSSMRSGSITCEDNQDLKYECSIICGDNHYECLNGECVCLDQNKRKSKDFKKQSPMTKINLMLNDFQMVIDKLRHLSNNVEPLEDEPLELEEHPALRHHIAHFCPDLEVARECIRTCMKVGKPAFCGKDHRCYCGHRYDLHTKDQKEDIADIYAQFRDLYEKYFGPEGGDPVIYL